MKTKFWIRLSLVGVVIVAFVVFAQAPVAAQAPATSSTSPVITSIVTGSNSALVTWDDLATGESGYDVYYSPNGSQWHTAGHLPPDSTSIEITGLTCSTHYFVDVVALGLGGNFRDSGQFTTLPCKLFLPLVLR